MERESSLGGRLRRLMEEEGLSYEQLGERLGMNPQTLNRYVLGQREPKIGTASAMAAALGVDPLWLLGYDVPRRTGQRQSVPILGTIRAGLPMAAEQRVEGWATADVAEPEEHFFLRVTGDSMIDQRRYPGRGSGAPAAAGHGRERPDCGLPGGRGGRHPQALPPPAGHGASPAGEPRL